MIKKFIIVVVAIVVASTAYYFIDGFLNPPPPPLPEKTKPAPEPWSEQENKIINAGVYLRGTSFTIYQNIFVGLQYPKTNVGVVLVARPEKGRVPSWMTNPRTFRGLVPGKAGFSPIIFNPKIKEGRAYVNVVFKQVPTESLGDTCKAPRSSTFVVKFPGISPKRRVFSTEISAPAPPKGRCLGEAGPEKVIPKVSLKRIQKRFQSNSSLIQVSGTSNLIGKTLIVSVGNRRYKVARVRSNQTWKTATFRIAKPKGPVYVRVGTAKKPGLAYKKTILVKP